MSAKEAPQKDTRDKEEQNGERLTMKKCQSE